MQAFSGMTVTQVAYAATGDINGTSLYASGDQYLPGGAIIFGGTSVTFQYHSHAGLSIGISGHGASLPTDHWYQSANLRSLTFNNDYITSVRGDTAALGIPGGSERIRAALNARPDVINALRKISAFFGKCAGKK